MIWVEDYMNIISALIKKIVSPVNINAIIWCGMKGINIDQAINREKEIKGWIRAKKIALIEEENPDWFFLNKDIME